MRSRGRVIRPGARLKLPRSATRVGSLGLVAAAATLLLPIATSTPFALAAATDAPDEAARDVLVAARDLTFEPDVIRSPAGTELTVTLTNAGLEPHNIAFTLEDGSPIEPDAVSAIIGAGETTEITFTTPEPGRYPFVCQVHPLEMVGSLRVGGQGRQAPPEPVIRPVPPALAEHPRIDPAAFRVTTFAWGLPYATGMLELEDGSILAAVAESDASGFIGASGKLLRMVDQDDDGVADLIAPVGVVAPAGGHGPLVLRELPGAVIQIRSIGDLVVMTTRQQGRSHLVVLRAGPPGDHLRLLGRLTFDYPDAHVHLTYGLALREGSRLGSVEAYFNVGSRLNDRSDLAPIAVNGLVEAAVQPEAIHRVTLFDDGEAVRASDIELIATGVRNGAGMAFDPLGGDLWFQDNGINLDDGSEDQLSADEIDVIPSEVLGIDVLDFGFPDAYVAAGTGVPVGSGGEPPVVALFPIDGSQSEGPAEITFAPPGFPDGLDSGIFVGFHGRYGLAGIANEENPLLYVDVTERSALPFLPNEAPDIGHLDNVLATANSLFVADINRLGPMGSTSPQGVIYQIKAVGDDG